MLILIFFTRLYSSTSVQVDGGSGTLNPRATVYNPLLDLRRHTWSLMNRFWTGQGPCRANLHNGVLPYHIPVIDRP